MKASFFISAIMLAALAFPSAAQPLHNEIGKTRCLDCHVILPFNAETLSFHEDIETVCRQCHNNDHAGPGLSHPVGIIPSMKIPTDMPLDRKGQMTCITCHTFHVEWRSVVDDNQYLLRRPEDRMFCFYCHMTFK